MGILLASEGEKRQICISIWERRLFLYPVTQKSITDGTYRFLSYASSTESEIVRSTVREYSK